MISVSDERCAWKSISASASNEHVTAQGCSPASYCSHSTICKSEVAPNTPSLGGLRARRGRSTGGGSGFFGFSRGGGFETFGGAAAVSFPGARARMGFCLGGFAASRAARSASLRARAAATAAPSPRRAAAARADPSSANRRFSASSVSPSGSAAAGIGARASETASTPRCETELSSPPPVASRTPTYRTHFQPSSALRSGLTDRLNAREKAETDWYRSRLQTMAPSASRWAVVVTSQ